MSCVSKHGRIFQLNEILNDHHRGRCAPIPVVKGSGWVRGIQTGPDWFESLPQEDQQAVMKNQAMYRAWQDGAISWGDMSASYQDEVYGEMIREASLSGILGPDAAKYYVQSL